MDLFTNIHLVSDATAETVESINSSIMRQFPNVKYRKFIWTVVDSIPRVNSLINSIKNNPGIILFSLLNHELIQYLEEKVVDFPTCKIINALLFLQNSYSSYFGIIPTYTENTKNYMNDKDYYKRVEAANYTYKHDDGKQLTDLNKADIILLGVSRTSKTPTSAYLAHRGYKVANIPIFLDKNNYSNENEKFDDIIEKIMTLNQPLIIGLTIDPNRLSELRTNRVHHENIYNNDYIKLDKIMSEILFAMKIFAKLKCISIDVTSRSIEEVAANIIRLLLIKQSRNKI